MTGGRPQTEPLGKGYCILETAYGHGGPTEYCTNREHGDTGWCAEHLFEWGRISTATYEKAVAS